jgi:HK97 family phage portal protein
MVIPPIAMAKDAIGMAIATEEYGGKFFANGASPGGVLEHPGVVKDPARIRESWNAVYQGSGNAHRIAVLEEGMKFQSIGIPPEQAQFLETRKFQTEEICRIFRVPPHLVANLDKATFSNIEHQSISFVVHTIRPWLVRLEQGMNKALLSPSEKGRYFVGFVVDGLLRGDYASRMQGYAIGIQNGFLSPNDVRTLENMNTIEHGDIYAMNGNMLKLEDVGAYANTNRKEVSQ